jgi:hypothetical protein
LTSVSPRPLEVIATSWIPVLGGAALERDVGEGQVAGALVRDQQAALEVLDVRDLDRELAGLLEARVANVVNLNDELLMGAAGLPMTVMGRPPYTPSSDPLRRKLPQEEILISK